MKNLLLLSLILFILFSCKKRKEITYPPSMIYGANVLAIDEISTNTDYSLGAELGKKADLKIVITNLSEQPNINVPKPQWFYSESTGWTVSDYTLDDTQTFTSNSSGEIVTDLIFSGSPGTCRIDYYENSAGITKTKYLSW